MSPETARRLAFGLWLLAVALVIPGPVLTTIVDASTGDIPFTIAFVTVQLAAATTGAVVATRLPRNPIGWIFLGMGAGLALAFAANSWSEVGLATDNRPLPADELAAWLGSWLFIPAVFTLFVPVCVATILAPAYDQTAQGTLLAQDLMTVVFAAPALATGVAILRYRLYDIDVVVNRALVYGGLTATLAAAYLAGVLLLGLALGPLTEDNDLAIAGSTLAVAALFRPARRRIQELFDRRFYRSRYDAAQTLAGFGAQLRSQVDLDALGGELRRVVADTMQPAHVSLWPREAR